MDGIPTIKRLVVYYWFTNIKFETYQSKLNDDPLPSSCLVLLLILSLLESPLGGVQEAFEATKFTLELPRSHWVWMKEIAYNRPGVFVSI